MTTWIRIAAALVFLVGEASWATAQTMPVPDDLPSPLSVGERDTVPGRDAILLLAQVQEQQGEFVPIDELPPQEALPAAPLLIGAYSFVMVMLFLYVLSVSRRLLGIQRDMERLQAQIARGDKG